MKMLVAITPTLYGRQGAVSDRIAAFDLDGTLIRSIRAKFFKDAADWAFLPHTIEALKFYQQQQYSIVIFTNQKYPRAQAATAVERVNNVTMALVAAGVNPWVLVATGDDMFRKPNVGMWQTILQYFPNLKKEVSFYVGDAAGRPQDHSDSDKIFANNIGLRFYTPEEIFPQDTITITQTPTMLVFVGMPGSGKTTYYQKNYPSWVHANQDNLKTMPKMVKVIDQALKQGKSVVVDATNSTAEKRKEFLDIARRYNIPAMILYFVGDGHGRNKLRAHPVPNVAYNMYYKNLVEPTAALDGVPVVQLR